MKGHLGNHISYLSNNTRYTRIFGRSHLDVGGGGDGDDGGDDGGAGGAPRFLRKQKPYKLSTNHSALQF